MVQSPCKDCINRELGCHSTCVRYKEFSNQRIQEKRNIKEQKLQHSEHISFLIAQRERNRRHHR